MITSLAAPAASAFSWGTYAAGAATGLIAAPLVGPVVKTVFQGIQTIPYWWQQAGQQAALQAAMQGSYYFPPSLTFQVQPPSLPPAPTTAPSVTTPATVAIQPPATGTSPPAAPSPGISMALSPQLLQQLMGMKSGTSAPTGVDPTQLCSLLCALLPLLPTGGAQEPTTRPPPETDLAKAVSQLNDAIKNEAKREGEYKAALNGLSSTIQGLPK